jgi:putative oxygen-independent coproporphyrinogen III oxidase
VSFGVYVHIPFCASRCDYCAFATWTDRGHLFEAYAEACRREIRSADLPAASSVFFGGGTPSLLPARVLCSILDVIPRQGDAEVTVECNPESVSASAVAVYRDGGVTRLSFGAQSTSHRVLESLGRSHRPGDLEATVELARTAGFTNFNVDLIFGTVGESLDDWARTLDDVLTLQPTHVSAYALTVEPGTPLASDPARHPDDDDQAEKYAVADATLGAGGFRNYEISNWATPGHECRHNALYWRQGNYRGIGCAAHSHQQGLRWWNVRTPERYIAAIESGRSPVAASEELDAETRELERLQLALRTREGVPADAVPADPTLDRLLEHDGDRVRLTVQGRLLANEVAVRLVPGGASAKEWRRPCSDAWAGRS